MPCHSTRVIDLADLQVADDAADSGTFRLLNDYQRGFPLVPEPFAAIGEECGLGEGEVLGALQAWCASGVISRVGPVFAPRRVGASALAALSAPKGWLHVIAERVSEFAEVNHNYQREHAFDLWFVVTAASAQRLQEVVAAIECDTGCQVVVLPLEEEFHIDLGFDLAGTPRVASSAVPVVPVPNEEAGCALPGLERRLMHALQGGLPLVARPFEALGRTVELGESMTIELIERWLSDGIVKRFGVIVRHHELGFRANAMCVWDVPDEEVGRIGRLLAAEPAVTLCYRRRRALPDWRYNLFCMIHGRTREAVRATRDELAKSLDLDHWPHDVLFSTRRFKQQGACYLREGDT
ncbi:Lrp/AsnC family transcriptional regulator [Azoarcus sp. KH32C]|uniref:siroheme decarboxylase subunit beta n=1 Tax=Azoarcus sp. KH32C TaxID=748247 RepID=UPI0002386664|nr:Lrp/AsnC family transcriptional regulator [Azoarcus sp. KH32C]BAL25829.1 putative transcriptional regulator, AsnC family [Azoarcus sp. KH32C]